MELREEITRGETASRKFAIEMAARGKTLPVIPGFSYNIHLWENKETPYFDMIELMEFYPSFELDKKGGNDQ